MPQHTSDDLSALPSQVEISLSAPPEHPMILPPGRGRRCPPSKALFTVSARGKDPRIPILDFLAEEYPEFPLSQVESVFGFAGPCSLYGGRPYTQPELSPRDIRTLHDCCIGVRLPLSNHHIDQDEYERQRPFLDGYHQRGNSVITTRDELARWIRRDYPDYEIEASVIKEVDSLEQLDRALELYDTVVLPMARNLDIDFLASIRFKDRVTLFADAGCALTCPAKICYPSFSKSNKAAGRKTACSFGHKPRELYGMLHFDLEKLISMGFSRFKALRTRNHGLTGF